VWGRIRRADEVARAQLLGTEEFRRGVLLSLVSEVASSYFNLLAVDRQLVIARETKAAFEKTLQLFDRKYQRGAGSKLDVERARANVADAAATIPQLESQRVAVENQLSVLIGRSPEAIPRGVGLEAQRLPVAPPGLPSELLERRPDVREAEQAVVAANAAVGVATANFFPRIGLTALWGGTSEELNDIVKHGARAWSFGGGLTGPLFQGGLLVAQYREQRAIWEGATARYQQTVLEAFADVSNALTAQESLAEQRVQRERQVKALEASVHLSLSRYEQGLASYFEVIDSQQRLFPAQLDLAETRRDELDATVQLYRALGGGWKLGPNWVRPAP
jgi:multidrug efflux system outer membrane protein